MSYSPHDAIVVQPGQDLAAVVAGLSNDAKVYLADGTHNVTSNILINGKSGICIEGSPAAIISDTRGAGFTIDLINSSSVTLRGFQIVTNAVNHAVRMGSVDNVRCLDLTVVSNAAGSTNNGAFAMVNGNCSNVLIQGCHVRGNFENTVRFSGGVGVTVTRIKVIDCHLDSGKGSGISNFDVVGTGGTLTDIILSGCTILGGDRGVYIANASRINISGCIIKSSRGDSVYLDTGASFVDVIACILDDPAGEGFQTATSALGDTTVGGCVIFSPGGSAVYVESPRCIVDGCVLDDPAQYCISFRAASNHVANACVAFSPGFDGFDVRSPSQIIINACVQKDSSFNGVATTGAVVHMTVSNCIFTTNGSERMIEFNSGTVDCLIEGNIIFDSAERSIYVNVGTRVSVIGNISDEPNHHHIAFEGASTNCIAEGNLCWQNTAAQQGINITSSNHIIRANLVAKNFNNSQNCIRVNGAGDILLEANHLNSGGLGRCVQVDGGNGARVQIAGNIVVGSGAGVSTISIAASTPATAIDCTVVECLSIDSSNYGITFSSARVAVVGCLIDHGAVPTNFGIRSVTTTPCQALVAFNLVRRMTGGIKIEGSIAHWNLKGNSVFASTTDGIWINTADEGNVCGNRITGSVSDGIQEDAGSDQNAYTENHVRGNAVATNFNGTNRLAADNKV